MAAQRPSGAPQNGHRNEVHLIGRLASEPVSTTLPSGDVVVSLRVVVDRDRRSRRPPSVDTVDCAAWSASIQRKVMG
ncbi:MAG: single-stranded DNA-binding protein, partial [Actinomycetes bacterium]